MITIQNEKLIVNINETGAELKKIYHREHELDYMWDSNPEFWGKSSPTLFPVVGRLAQDKFLHKGVEYDLTQHGFARDLPFTVIEKTDSSVVFELVSNEMTLAKYPFKFKLQIGYELNDETLNVSWHVQNETEESMYFSIGAHPAFSTKLSADDTFTDYYLHFENNEGIETILFDQSTGRVYNDKEIIMEKLKLLPISADLFAEYGALILEGETGITLSSYNHDREVYVKFDGFPYVGIWTAVKSDGTCGDFVCIEPWYGHGDTVEAPQEIKDKKGIQILQPNEKFDATYQMTFR